MKKLSVNSVILDFYLSIVWFAYFFTYISCEWKYAFIFLILCVIVNYVVSDFVLKKIGKLDFISCNYSGRGVAIRTYIIYTVIAFAYCMLFYIAFYPGSFAADMYSQYQQALTNTYNDWHPVWYAIVFFKIPTLLGGGLAQIVLVHMLYFSFVFGYLGYTMHKHAGARFTIIVLAYIYLNPFIGFVLTWPIKDSGFSITCCLAITMAADIYLSKKNCEDRDTWARMIALGFVLANASVFRHNGILFTFFVAFALFFSTNKKRWIALAVSFLLTFVIIKGPIYSALKVEKDVPYRVIETTGLPLSMIASVVADDYDSLDDDTREFVLAIAPREQWISVYQLGNFNTIKWNCWDIYEVTEEYGTGFIVSKALKCLVTSPKASLRGFFATTDLLYGLENGIKNELDNEISLSYTEYGIDYIGYKGVKSLADAIHIYKSFVSNSIFNYFRTIGMTIILVLVATLSKMKLNRWDDWKRIFFAFPLLAYDFGTMLLLTGPDSRFFYVSFLTCPAILLIMLVNVGEKDV